MYKKLLLILSVFSVCLSSAQVTFEKKYYHTLHWNHGNTGPAILNTIDSGYYMFSWNADSIRGDSSFFMSITRVDKLGSVLWNKNSGKYSNAYNYGLGGVLQFPDSSIVLQWDDQLSGQSWRGGLSHTDKNGNVIWGKKYSFPGGNQYYINDIAKTLDNCIVTWGENTDVFTNQTKPVLMKTDSLGNLIWCKEYLPNAISIYGARQITRITLEKDSGFLLTFGTQDSSTNRPCSFLMKTDKNGNQIWSKKYYKWGPTFTKPIISNGYVYLCGIDTINANSMVLKTDSVGNPIWAYSYYLTYPLCYDETTDNYGNLIFCISDGFTHSAILKTDSSGNILWANNYTGTDSTLLFRVYSTPDFGIIGNAWVGGAGGSASLGSKLIKTNYLGKDGCEIPYTINKRYDFVPSSSVTINVIDTTLIVKDTLLNFSTALVDTFTYCPLTYMHKPIAKIYLQGDTLCNGSCLCFTDSSLNDPFKWSWLFVGANPTSSNVENPCNICYSTPGKYPVTLIASNYKGSDTTYDTVIVVSKPSIGISGKDSICVGDSTTLIALPNGLSYLWSTGSSRDSISINPSSSKTYTLTASNGYCSVDTTFTIFVSALPIDSLVYNTKICIGKPDTITAFGGIIYKWSTGDTGATIIINPALNTTFTVSISNGICSISDSGKIQVYNYPITSISDTQYICPAQSVTISASGGSYYLWSTGDTTSSISVNPLTSSIYNVDVSNGVCVTKDSSIVVVNPSPIPNVCCDITIVYGESVELTASGAIRYLWSPSNGICDTCENITVMPSQTTTYTVTLTSDSGCVTQGFLTIDVGCGNVFIPTAFSPSEANNSILYVRGVCITSMDFCVFDRWGNKVFESENPDKGWDGTYKGQPMNMGTYVWFLTATLQDGTKVEKKGNVTLVR